MRLSIVAVVAALLLAGFSGAVGTGPASNNSPTPATRRKGVIPPPNDHQRSPLDGTPNHLHSLHVRAWSVFDKLKRPKRMISKSDIGSPKPLEPTSRPAATNYVDSADVFRQQREKEYLHYVGYHSRTPMGKPLVLPAMAPPSRYKYAITPTVTAIQAPPKPSRTRGADRGRQRI
ncbi:hypothetical protein AX17_007155 [Amanita inopinata Kibby_2008]|nr:hypothetical protein AX17_007155 [Amanita inopinata Kibby_2008]